MDPNQVNQNPTPVVDPNAGIQAPSVEPMMPATPPVTPVEPVAPLTPEPVMPTPEPVVPVESTPIVEDQPVAPVAPVVPQGGDVGGEQMPPTTPPATV